MSIRKKHTGKGKMCDVIISGAMTREAYCCTCMLITWLSLQVSIGAGKVGDGIRLKWVAQ